MMILTAVTFEYKVTTPKLLSFFHLQGAAYQVTLIQHMISIRFDINSPNNFGENGWKPFDLSDLEKQNGQLNLNRVLCYTYGMLYMKSEVHKPNSCGENVLK